MSVNDDVVTEVLFSDLDRDERLQRGVADAGFVACTPIQARSLPLLLSGQDVAGQAQTGTGKTAAYLLATMNRLLAEGAGTVIDDRPAPAALVLAPTRELAIQIHKDALLLGVHTEFRFALVYGGVDYDKQRDQVAAGVDILIGTPGRLIDLMDRRAVDLGQVRHLVLDEADQMLDMGFIHALRKIAPKLGSPRQTMLFSATMPKQMEELSRAYLTNPQRVQVSPPGKAADKITQSIHFVSKPEKPSKLREILSQDPDALTLVFSRTKHGAEKLMKGLVADGYNAASIHGNKSQGQRDRAIKAVIGENAAVEIKQSEGLKLPGVF